MHSALLWHVSLTFISMWLLQINSAFDKKKKLKCLRRANNQIPEWDDSLIIMFNYADRGGETRPNSCVLLPPGDVNNLRVSKLKDTANTLGSTPDATRPR